MSERHQRRVPPEEARLMQALARQGFCDRDIGKQLNRSNSTVWIYTYHLRKREHLPNKRRAVVKKKVQPAMTDTRTRSWAHENPTITASMSPEEVMALDAVAEWNKVTRADVIRSAVRRVLKEHESALIVKAKEEMEATWAVWRAAAARYQQLRRSAQEEANATQEKGPIDDTLGTVTAGTDETHADC